MTSGTKPAGRLSYRRIVGFTLGDFGCNVYWQSITLFLLFFYTDVVGLSAAAAGLIYMIASVWDGVIDPVMGMIAERTRTRFGRYRAYILFGPVPLAISFVTLYYNPHASAFWTPILLLATHMLFRTCYTVVSIPYTSLSARMTSSGKNAPPSPASV